MGYKGTDMLKFRRGVCIYFDSCLVYMFIGVVSMEVNTIPMQVLGMGRRELNTEWTDFYRIGDCVNLERVIWLRLVILLGCLKCMFIFVQLLRPTGRLISDKAAGGPREADGTVW